jgi:hypothetical protein
MEGVSDVGATYGRDAFPRRPQTDRREVPAPEHHHVTERFTPEFRFHLTFAPAATWHCLLFRDWDDLPGLVKNHKSLYS